MRRIAIRVPDSLWGSIRSYAISSGLIDGSRQIDISETLRDLIMRGLSNDQSLEAGYRAGYREGRLLGYQEFMARFAHGGGK